MRVVEVPLDSLDLRYGRLRARRAGAERRLLASMGEGGQQSPVIVVAGREPGRYVLIDGRKRVRALRRLQADAVKAVVWEMEPPEALVAAYQLASGAGWNALEEGFLVEELVRTAGLSLAEVGEKLERSKAWVSGRLGLVEALPGAVLEGVVSGKIGAYVATRHLLPFARANAADCERLAAEIAERGFCSREVEELCRFYATAGRAQAQRMLEDPARFLMARAAAREGMRDAALSEAENRCVKNLELIGNVALGLTRRLPQACGYDTGEAARGKLEGAWLRCRQRFSLLAKTTEGLFGPAGLDQPRTAAVAADPEREALSHAG